MGGTLTCLAVRQKEDCSSCGDSIATLSPVHTLRRRSSRRSSGGANIPTLQDAAVNAVAAGLLGGAIASKQLSVLPYDLLQRVIDLLVAKDALTLQLLQSLVCPWLHHLHLEGLSGVDDDWLPVVAGARHLISLNLSGAALTDSGTSWLAWLWELRALQLEHCSGLTDAGLAPLHKLTALHTLSLEGCDGITCASLASIGRATGLTHLNLGQCYGLTGQGVSNLTGLTQLQCLSLGWCPSLGDVRHDPCNSIQPLAALTALTSLNLGGTKVSDAQVQQVLPALAALQELDLSRSSVTGAGLPALQRAAGSLRVLKLRGCQLSDPSGPAALSVLSRLRSLDLSCSSISTAGLLHLGRLSGLTELLLDMCRIGDEACRVLRHLGSLEVLDLSDTDVSEAGVTWISGCRHLAWLSLCNTEVGDAAASSLSGLTRLTSLNMDSRCVSDGALPLLLRLGPGLRELDLSGARVTARGAALLAAAFTALEKLDLCGGHVTDRACMQLAKLARLRHLNLAQNRAVSDIGANLLANGPVGQGLQGLNLSYTGVSDVCIPMLAGMQALEVAVLSFTAVSEAGAARLRAARPRLMVKASRKPPSSTTLL